MALPLLLMANTIQTGRLQVCAILVRRCSRRRRRRSRRCRTHRCIVVIVVIGVIGVIFVVLCRRHSAHCHKVRPRVTTRRDGTQPCARAELSAHRRRSSHSLCSPLFFFFLLFFFFFSSDHSLLHRSSTSLNSTSRSSMSTFAASREACAAACSPIRRLHLLIRPRTLTMAVVSAPPPRPPLTLLFVLCAFRISSGFTTSCATCFPMPSSLRSRRSHTRCSETIALSLSSSGASRWMRTCAHFVKSFRRFSLRRHSPLWSSCDDVSTAALTRYTLAVRVYAAKRFSRMLQGSRGRPLVDE